MEGPMEDIKSPRKIDYAISGGSSGAVTRMLLQPLDVIKIRFQLQVEPIAHGSKYATLIQAMKLVLREEGFTALWQGHVPAQCLSITYGLVQFWSFEMFQEYSLKIVDSSLDMKNTRNFLCGALAATIATSASYPFDTIRTRLVAQTKSNVVYKGLVDTAVTMVRSEGVSSLYKGLLPTLSQIAPYVGIQFTVYKLLKQLTSNIEGLKQQSEKGQAEATFVANLLCGSLAGFVSKVTIYPLDLCKKRLQIQGFQHQRRNFGTQFVCRGMVDCIGRTVQGEGFRGLFKGLAPSLIKASLASALHFALYEEFLRQILKFR